MPDGMRPRFDPTINLGHVITGLMLVASVFLAWATLDKRVTLLEQGLVAEKAAREAEARRGAERFGRIQASQNRIEDKLDRLILDDRNRRNE